MTALKIPLLFGALENSLKIERRKIVFWILKFKFSLIFFS